MAALDTTVVAGGKPAVAEGSSGLAVAVVSPPALWACSSLTALLAASSCFQAG
jgi:hypothetical protein